MTIYVQVIRSHKPFNSLMSLYTVSNSVCCVHVDSITSLNDIKIIQILYTLFT